MNLIKYAVKRLIIMAPILFGVLTFTFILSRLMPGDPAVALLQARGLREFPIEVYRQMVRQLGFDDPLIIQYFRYISELFTGNWGVSVSIERNQPVWNLIMENFPRTVDLTIFSMLLGSFLGIKLGIIAATHRSERPDMIVRGLSLIGVSIPIFFLGMLMQYVFGILIPIFDPIGYRSALYEDPPVFTGFYIIDALISGKWGSLMDYILHLILPVICLSFVVFASISRQIRASMLDELSKDYVRTARAKGCKEKDLVRDHVLQNALIPTITITGLNLANLLTGVLFIEITFGITGMGQLFIEAILLTDYWVLSAIVFLITILFILTNLITDIIYAKLDPRIRYK